MKRAWLGIAILVLTAASVATGQEPTLPMLELPVSPPERGDSDAGSRVDDLYRSSFAEISQHYEHYRQQAFRYQWIDRVARFVMLVASAAAALILAMTESKRAKRGAIVLSMIVATTQAAEQQFNLGKMREVSWRTAVDLNRVLSEFREEWMFTNGTDADLDEAVLVVRRYRERFNAAVEREMNVSLAPMPRTP